MELGRALLFLYAIWGNGTFARFLRSTAVQLGTIFAQFMLAFWLWSLAPWPMTFILPIGFIVYAYAEKGSRIRAYQKEEAARQAADLAWVRESFKHKD